jgi:prepilin-type N-terminal cleavage/methylation domain-containing protein
MNVRPALPRATRRGMSIVEVLIALAITALLLTAVAVAYSASARAIEVNDEFFRATQAGRVSLLRVLTDVRQGTVKEDALTDSVRLITTPPDGQVARDRTYQYRPANKQLVMITNDDATDLDYILANNVSAVMFTKEIGKDANNANCVTRLAMTITVTVGKHSIQLSGAAAPRRYLLH